MSNINTIRLSGTTYQIEDSNAPKTVELTQAQYDALVDKDPNTFYVITDAEAGDLTNYYTKTETNTLLNGKQATLESGTNIKTINNESILGEGNIEIQGGGSSYTGVSGVTINNNNEIYYDGIYKTWLTSNHSNDYAVYWFRGRNAKIWISDTAPTSSYMHWLETQFSFGGVNNLGNSSGAVAFGQRINISGFYASSFGQYNDSKNQVEFSVGQYNTSSTASTTFGDSGNTLFSVGNGTSTSARHNAFEIRQNGDIYLTKDGQDVKLQDQLGGGSSYTAGDGIDITNDVISVTGKANTSAVTEIQDSLSGYVTTDTEQHISGRKVFTYSSRETKAIEFKQTRPDNKVGFRVTNSANTNNEVASFELRPNTFTIDGVKHPLLYFGHYRSIDIASAGVPQTVIGFRQYDEIKNAAYHYLIPLPEKAKAPFQLSKSFKDYYAPMGFKNGSTMITADDTGVVDLSSELGGLKLVKLTQAEYDALATKDSNTLYVIVN